MEEVVDLKTDFLSELEQLYSNIEEWVHGTTLTTFPDNDISINEEAVGEYVAPILVITPHHGREVAHIRPVGASIIGAKGRADLIGRNAKEILSLLDNGGPTIMISEGSKQVRPRPLLNNVNEAGWYWIESRTLGRAHKLTKELFFELLKRVSNYAVEE